MRSYYEHLETAQGKIQVIPPKPTVRSSAIFPVMNLPGITTRILFMGYWILKRNINAILAVVNLRSEKGDLIGRETFTITEPKTYRIELQDQLKKAGFLADTLFYGSLEIEFFSTVNLVFPYPAVVVNYYGPRFCTVVHTAQRIYNDFEDLNKNSQTIVPESGFNIYADQKREPFIGLINGAESVENCEIKFEFFNIEGKNLQGTLSLGTLSAYETRFIYPAREFPLQDFLGNEAGTGKIYFQVNWIFPRLLVGNVEKQLPALSVTHSYYDTTGAGKKSDYWKPAEPGWHAAALMVPCAMKENHYTNIYFYPIYSPSQFAIDLELYSRDGKCVGKKEKALIVEAPFKNLYKIDLKQIASNLSIDLNKNYGARLIAKTLGESLLPARIKIGLDIGKDNGEFPCNICTNLQPFNPELENKPTSFRWGPVLSDQEHSSVWLMNSSPKIEYNREAEIEVTFYREKDAQAFSKKMILPCNGFIILNPAEDKELNAFFENRIGWFTAVSTNPYTSTFYFAENSSGIVGGDHGF